MTKTIIDSNLFNRGPYDTNFNLQNVKKPQDRTDSRNRLHPQLDDVGWYWTHGLVNAYCV